MIQRRITPRPKQSFFLFGARGTGKSTFLREQFKKPKNTLWIDLLNLDDEDRYGRDPMLLDREIAARSLQKLKPELVIIDEIQKLPRLLDVVHRIIERDKIPFALTGSSARKLKRGGANLLGGRALVYVMHPFSYSEIQNSNIAFDLDNILHWGSLPNVWLTNDEALKTSLLRSYANTYLKEEILIEQLVRDLIPFKGFLEISAQMNAERLNYQKIAREVGVDNRTVQSYFDILEETFLGFRLPAFHGSRRKSQLLHPKFYWFDLGVQRSLAGQLRSIINPQTALYGKLFESWLITEIFRMNIDHELDFQLSYLQTKNGPEIDLILTRGKESIAIEIKSAKTVDPIEMRKLDSLADSIPSISKKLYISQDKKRQSLGPVEAIYWKDVFELLLKL